MHLPRSAAFFPASALNHTDRFCNSDCVMGSGCGGKINAVVLGFALHAALVKVNLLPKTSAYDDYTFDTLRNTWCAENLDSDPYSVMDEEDITRVVCDDESDDEDAGPAMPVYVRLQLEVNSLGQITADNLDYRLYTKDGQIVKQGVLEHKEEISMLGNLHRVMLTTRCLHADMGRILVPIAQLHNTRELVKEGSWYVLRLFDGSTVHTARAL